MYCRLDASRKLHREEQYYRAGSETHTPTHTHTHLHAAQDDGIVLYILGRLDQAFFHRAHTEDQREGLNGVLQCSVEDSARIIPETPQVSREFGRKVSRETSPVNIIVKFSRNTVRF